jgi:superfamily II DNA/RNA helicase
VLGRADDTRHNTGHDTVAEHVATEANSNSSAVSTEDQSVTATRTSNFGGVDLVGNLLAAIEGATKRIWLVVPWWRRESPLPVALFDALSEAAGRGVEVRVIIRNDASNLPIIDALRTAGVLVRGVRYVHYKELHADERVITFSANFTTLELSRNQNVGYDVVGSDSESARDAFLSLWSANSAEVSAGDEVWTPAADIVPSNVLALLGHDQLNPLQAKALPVVFGSSEHLVVVAPTGSGKTDIGEAAVLRTIKLDAKRAVYLTPARALTGELSERFARWRQGGLRIVQLTGEDDVDLDQVRQADLWVATTEKFEALCRKTSLADAVAGVGCIVVDEIHFVGSSGRGSTLEALLARLRMIADQTRIVGLSATVANADEIAGWLNAVVVHSEWRPVQLSIQVLGFTPGRTRGETEQAKNALVKQAVDDVTTTGGQVVVFCGSKRSARLTAAHIAGLTDVDLDDAEGLAGRCLPAGVGVFYRGLRSAKEAEREFRARRCAVLVATSGLAQGVNLPARAVIVRDTVLGQNQLSVGDAMQMFGRAGRVGQETEGHGFLLAPSDNLGRWRSDLAEGHTVRSQILDSLADHVLADVLLGRLGTARELRQWFEGTLAAYQGQDGDAPLDRALEALLEGGFLQASGPEQVLTCTALGKLTSRFLVEVWVATTLRSALAEVTPGRDCDDAECSILVAVASAVPSFSETACPHSLRDELDTLLSSSPFQDLPESVGPGSRKTLLAAHLALTDPGRLESRKSVGPFNVVDLIDLCAELPRYLSWVGALGRATTLGWPVPIAADLAARIEWRRCRPTRGAGRLLRLLVEMLPVEDRRRAMPELYQRAISRGKLSPDDIVDKPQVVPITDRTWERLRAGRVQAEIADVTTSDSEVVVAVTASTGTDLVAQATAHAGASESGVYSDHWAGAPLRLPIPGGSSGGRIAVDVLLFGRSDWAYTGGSWSVDVDEEVEITAARRLVEQLPETGVSNPRGRFWTRTFGSAERRWREQVAALASAPQPYLAPLARHLAGEGGLEMRCYRLRDNLCELLSLAKAPGGPRPPADVLRSGVGTPAEVSLTLACLLAALGEVAGVAASGDRSLVAVVYSRSGWAALPLPGCHVGTLRSILPKTLPTVTPVLAEPPIAPPAEVAERWTILSDYRSALPAAQ